MKIDERAEHDVTVLAVRERRVDARSAPALRDTIAGCVGRGHEWIVLDLADVEFVDSSGLGVMVSGLKLLGRRGDLVLSGARPAVLGLLELTRMDRVFRVFPSAGEAVQALVAREA
jgi:anti-sigma B factor antagonist